VQPKKSGLPESMSKLAKICSVKKTMKTKGNHKEKQKALLKLILSSKTI
jgi:hypothetical protein